MMVVMGSGVFWPALSCIGLHSALWSAILLWLASAFSSSRFLRNVWGVCSGSRCPTDSAVGLSNLPSSSAIPLVSSAPFSSAFLRLFSRLADGS